MVLYIDTTQREQLIVQILAEDGKVIAEHNESQGFNHAQNLLPAIESLLQANNLSLKDLIGIKVNPGPGSFTGTRVGVAVANALSFALHIPVNDLSVGQARPIYDREPNISQPKTAK